MSQQLETTKKQKMSPAEAKFTHEEIGFHFNKSRRLLIEMRDRDGWIHLGYSSFDEYGQKAWNIGRTYLGRLVRAEEIQKSLSVPQNTEIPESQLRPLSVVSEIDRDAIYQQALKEAEAKGEKMTAAKVQEAVKAHQQKLKDAETALKVKEAKIDEMDADLQELQLQLQNKDMELDSLRQQAVQQSTPTHKEEAIDADFHEVSPVYDDIFILDVNDYYGHLADVLIKGLTEQKNNLEDFNKCVLKNNAKVQKVLNMGNKDRLAQATELLADFSASLDFLLTGKARDF